MFSGQDLRAARVYLEDSCITSIRALDTDGLVELGVMLLGEDHPDVVKLQRQIEARAIAEWEKYEQAKKQI